MKKFWEALLTSKKFTAFLASMLSLLIAKIGWSDKIDPDTVQWFVTLVSAYLLGQGIADMGKEAKKVEAIAPLMTEAPAAHRTVAEAKAIEEVKKL